MKRALAIFAKAPAPGVVKTRLAPYLLPEECAELYRCMLLDTIERVRELPVATVVFFDGDESFFRDAFPGVELIRQHPAGLGERLQHAFAFLAEQGYRLRVTIGSDAPDLPLRFIMDAFAALETGTDAVFGPAEDGGYYLVGLSREDGGIFRDIPWSTSAVLEKSLAACREAGFSGALLSPWYDVDCYDDLWRPGLSAPDGPWLTRTFINRLSMSLVRESKGLAG